MLGSPGLAHGFLTGWITRSIRDLIEKKNNDKFTIDHTSEPISNDEIKEYTISMFRKIADDIEKDVKALRRKLGKLIRIDYSRRLI